MDKWRLEIEKKYGKSAIKSGAELQPRTYRGTGSIAFDVALGGGWGKFSIVQVMGKEGAGKTLLFDLAAVEAMRIDPEARALVLDFEGTYDKRRFELLGGDLDRLDVIDHQSTNRPMLFAEDAIDIVKSIFQNGSPHHVILFDSTGAMMSIHEYEAKMDGGQEKETRYGVARTMSDGLKIMLGTMFKSPVMPTIFLVSQGRDNMGAMMIRGIPPRDKQTGGRALPFFASTRVNVSKGEVFKADVDDDETGRSEKGVEVGHVTKVAVWKNKCNSTQGRTAEFNVYNEGVHGIDRIDELAKLAIYTRAVIQAGAYYDLAPEINNGLKRDRVHGLPKLKELLADPVTFDFVYQLTKVRLTRMMDTAPKAVDPEGDDDDQSETEQTSIT